MLKLSKINIQYKIQVCIIQNMFYKFEMYKLLPKDKRNELENRVDVFFQEKNIKLNEKIDITGVCNNLGIRVLSLSFSPALNEQVHGVIFVDGADKQIGVNSSLDTRAARFVVSHELSHYITDTMLSNGKNKQFAHADSHFDSDEKPDEEREMDYMAAAILVRKEVLEEDLKVLAISEINSIDDVEAINPRKIEMLAERFNVKEEVIKRRIYEVCA